MGHVAKTRATISTARRCLGTLLDLRQISDEHPLGRAARQAFDSLEEVVEQLKDCPESINDDGPLVYPIPGEDPRDYATSRGSTARHLLESQPEPWMREIAETGLRLVAPSDLRRARVLTWPQYLSGLRRSRPYDSLRLATAVN